MKRDRRPNAGASQPGRPSRQVETHAPPSASPTPVRLLLCDDQLLVRTCVRQFLQSTLSIRVVGEAADGHAAVRMALELQPDVVLLDVSMPGLDGIEATRQILAKAPAIRVLAFSADARAKTMKKMLAAGARGYLLKTDDPQDWLSALQEFLTDKRFLGSQAHRSTTSCRRDQK